MSLVGANGLNTSLKEKKAKTPAEILNNLNTFVSDSLNKSREENHIRDGMDIALCSVDYETLELKYAGANNALYIIRNNEFIITKPDKYAIGSFEPGSQSYTEHTIQLQENDMIYLFSDGFADQFGGMKGKKFLYNRFREHLLKIHQEQMPNQKNHLRTTIKKWQGPFEQVDDILVIGVRI
jgi:serine phosphatase RsbU (regulator of sigma subunit)